MYFGFLYVLKEHQQQLSDRLQKQKYLMINFEPQKIIRVMNNLTETLRRYSCRFDDQTIETVQKVDRQRFLITTLVASMFRPGISVYIFD